MNYNFVLAFFWMLMGGTVLVLSWTQPELVAGHIVGTKLPLTWLGPLGLLLSLWNVYRWRSTRSYDALRRQAEQEKEARRRDIRRAPPPAPDPNFQFTDETAPPEGRSGEPRL